MPIFLFALSGNAPAYSGIRVDGEFEDWSDSVIYSDPNAYSVAGLNIIEYSADTNDAGGLFLYARAGSAWFPGSDADSMLAFIDSDGSATTGYAVRDIGAEYAVEVWGWSGVMRGKQFGAFGGSDQHNWSAWTWRGLTAAVSGDSLELGIPSSLVTLGQSHRIMFMTKRGAAPADVCDAAIAVDAGAVCVRQVPQAQNGIATADAVMTLQVTAPGQAVVVNSVAFSSNAGTPTVSGLPATIAARQTETLTVTLPVGTLAAGQFIDVSVSGVTTDCRVTVLGDGLRAYANSAPAGISVDGAFGDWNAVAKHTDSDPAADPNVDIAGYAAANSTARAYFYMRVSDSGAMMGGAYAPGERIATTPGEPGEPGEPGTPTPKPKVSGEDLTRVYIDTRPGGGSMGGIHPDYLVEVRGRNGRITSAALYSLPRAFVANIDAANGARELELSMTLAQIQFSGNLSYYMESTDWQSISDRTVAFPLTRADDGTRNGPDAPEPFAGTLTYISAPVLTTTITVDGAMASGEWDGASVYDGDDFDLHVLVSGNYLYVAVAVTSDTAANAADGCILYFDQDHSGSGTPQTGDRRFMTFDTTGTPANSAAVGDGIAWVGSGPLDWTADSSLDGQSVVYEFQVNIAEVWGTDTPTTDQVAGFAVDIWDSDGDASYQWGSNSVSHTDLGTWGDIIYAPEFGSIAVPMLLCVIPVIAYRAGRRSSRE